MLTGQAVGRDNATLLMPPVAQASNIVDGKALFAQNQTKFTEIYNSSTLDIESQIRAILAQKSTTTRDIVVAIGYAESNLDPEALNNDDKGIYQITSATWKEQCGDDPLDAFDIKKSTECTAEMVEENQLWRWENSREDMPKHTGWFNRLATSTQQFVLRQDELCSCLIYARRFLPTLPVVATPALLKPNAMPAVGRAVLLDYTIGGSHIAVITSINDSGFNIVEANFKRCQKTNRFIPWSDTHIRGFYDTF